MRGLPAFVLGAFIMFSSVKNRLGSMVPARLIELWEARNGVTALEYGIIASVMAITLVGIFGRLSVTMSTIMSGVDASI